MIAFLIHIPLLLFLAHRFGKARNAPPLFYWSTLSIRVFCGWALGLLYLYYYTDYSYTQNDTWFFFGEAEKLSFVVKDKFSTYLHLLWVDDMEMLKSIGLIEIQERSLLFIRILSVLNLLCFHSYWIVSAYLSLASFLCAWILFEKISVYFPDAKTAAAISFLLWPSVLFWSSGIIKDTLALGGIFLISAIIIQYENQGKTGIGKIVLAGLAFYMSWKLKYYWAGIFITAAVAYIICHHLRSTSLFRKHKFSGWVLTFCSLLLLASLLHPNFHFDRILSVIISNHDQFVMLSKPEGLIHYYQLQSTWTSLFINMPLALFSGLFRPLPWEAHGLTSLVASLENSMLLILATVSLINALRKKHPFDNLQFIAVFTYIVVLCVFLALSTPNLGTLSRYRIGFLPFFVFIITYRNPVMITVSEWLKNKFRME